MQFCHAKKKKELDECLSSALLIVTFEERFRQIHRSTNDNFEGINRLIT